MKRANISKIAVYYDVPSFLVDNLGKIQHDLHNQLIDHLMDMPRCKEYQGGHWDCIVFYYDGPGHLQKWTRQDATAIQTVVDMFRQKAKQ